jgi:hypothetical protein
MSAAIDIDQRLAEQELAAEQARTNAQRAKEIESEIGDLTRDIERLTRQRDACAAAGDEPLRVPWQHNIPGHPEPFDMEPFKTALTGVQLAERCQGEIDYLTQYIAKRRAQLEGLLA